MEGGSSSLITDHSLAPKISPKTAVYKREVRRCPTAHTSTPASHSESQRERTERENRERERTVRDERRQQLTLRLTSACHCKCSCHSSMTRFVAHQLRHGAPTPPKRTECVLIDEWASHVLAWAAVRASPAQEYSVNTPACAGGARGRGGLVPGTERDQRTQLHSRLTLMSAGHFNHSFPPGNSRGKRSWADTLRHAGDVQDSMSSIC